MSYKLVKEITKVNKSVMNNKQNKYIVIHYTGNKTDSAAGNANYFKNTNRGASAHYFVDETTVYQVVEDKDAAWAVGRNYGNKALFNSVKNSNSISIEMCSKNGKITDNTFKNTVELTKKLMKKYGIKAEHVYRHYDVCSKMCPGWTGWIGKDEHLWKKFKHDIASSSAPKVTITKQCRLYKQPMVTKGYYETLKLGKEVTQVKDNGKGWSEVHTTVGGKAFVGFVKNTCLSKKSLSHYRIGEITKAGNIKQKNKKTSKTLGKTSVGQKVKIISVGKYWTNVKIVVGGKEIDAFVGTKKVAIK